MLTMRIATILRFLVIVILTIISVSCQNSPTLTVCGKIPAAAGKMVYVDSLTLTGPICTDSVLASEDGSFEIKRNAAKRMTFFQLRADSLSAAFCADSTEKINFDVALRRELILTGDEYAVQVCKLSQHVKATNKYIKTLMQMGDKFPKKKMKKLIYARVMQYRAIADSLIKENPVSPVAFYAINAKLIYDIEPYDFNDPDDYHLLAIVTNGWNMIRHGNVYSNQLLAKLDQVKLAQIASKHNNNDETSNLEQASFVNLEFPNAVGDIISLNSIKRKNIILLFWDLRMIDNDVFSKILDYYQTNTDIEIYHVNYYKNDNEFKKDASKCPWICVNDEEGISSVTYNLEVTPSVFLFNKTGDFVGKNIPFIGYKF